MKCPDEIYGYTEDGEILRPWARVILTKDNLVLHRWSRALLNSETKDSMHREIARKGVKLIDLAVDHRTAEKAVYVYPVPVHDLDEDDRDRLIAWADTCGYSKIYLDNREEPIELDGKIKYPKDAVVQCPICKWECQYNAPYLHDWVDRYGRLPEFCNCCAGESIPQWEAQSPMSVWRKPLFGGLTTRLLETRIERVL